VVASGTLLARAHDAASFPREKTMLLRCARRCRHFVSAIGVALLMAAGAKEALAQEDQLGNKQTVEAPYQKLQPNINQYVAGQIQPTGPNDMEAKTSATVAAKWFVYPMTWKVARENNRELLPDIVRQFDRFMAMATRRDFAARNKAFMELFNQQMISTFKELLARDFKADQVSQVNGCVLLPILARYGDDAFGNYLVELLKDGKLHDALKVHALKGLRAFFVARPPVLDVDDQRVREGDAARVAAVLAFVTRAAPKTPEEVEAYRFIRREAIKALAQSRIPAEAIDKNGVKTPVALGLMKVLAAEKNGISPPPSLTEKAEAAIGLCRMNTKLDKYQPEAAVCLVGKFLTEFAAKYREDAPNLKGTEVPPLIPWRFYASRLEEGLQEMNRNARDPAYANKLKTLLANSKGILDSMKRHNTIDEPASLVSAVTAMWPQAPALTPYQGVPGTQIQMPAAPQGQ
jgi:hypothetical protein